MEPITASERFISDHQLDVQETAIDAELLRLDMMITIDSPDEAHAFRVNLQNIKQGIKETRWDLHKIPVKKKRMWDRIRIRLYLWSVRGRFEAEE